MGADAQPIRVSVVASTSTPDHLELPRRPLKTDPMAVLQGHRGVGFSKDPINVLVTFALYFNPQGSTYRIREMYAYLMYFDPYIAVMRYQERL